MAAADRSPASNRGAAWTDRPAWGQDSAPFAPAGPGPWSAYVALRANGVKQATAWCEEERVAFDAVLRAINDARSSLPADRAARIDAIEICLADSFEECDLARDRDQLTDDDRGRTGLELRYRNRAFIYAPTDMIARNLSFARVLERFAESQRLSEEQVNALQVRSFDAAQYLVRLRPFPNVFSLSRGSRLVPLENVTHLGVARYRRLMGEWLKRHVHDDGRLTYKYWPSRGRESAAVNMLRQWMGTICLGRLARASGDPELAELSDRNLQFNLERSYRTDGDLGLILCGRRVKLGAVALAALALVERPDRDRYAPVEASLRRTVDRLWNEDGSFTTFYRPPGARHYQNFYPGEALLLCARLYDDAPDQALLERIWASFEYYRDFHRQRPNPAFVPWHTQAYCRLWRRTGSYELRDFVFEMNDWLLGIQQWDDAPCPEAQGQFHDPQRPEFGPPHASSTGAYLEGLIEAYVLAREVDDEARSEAYRLAIRRGLRSVMQLQFADHVDMYYISKKDRARGGIRTTFYDNSIRVDNVQHNLMAAMRIAEVFSPQDYLA